MAVDVARPWVAVGVFSMVVVLAVWLWKRPFCWFGYHWRSFPTLDRSSSRVQPRGFLRTDEFVLPPQHDWGTWSLRVSRAGLRSTNSMVLRKAQRLRCQSSATITSLFECGPWYPRPGNDILTACLGGGRSKQKTGCSGRDLQTMTPSGTTLPRSTLCSQLHSGGRSTWAAGRAELPENSSGAGTGWLAWSCRRDLSSTRPGLMPVAFTFAGTPLPFRSPTARSTLSSHTTP